MNSAKHGTRSRIGLIALLTAASFLCQGSLGPTTNLDQRLLAAHNRERAAAGVPPLQWNAELASSAAEWGAHLAKLGYLEHYPSDERDPNPQGENLWAGSKGYYSAEQMIELWAAEKKHYKAGVFPANSRTGALEDVAHYTQLMWRSTEQVGCALSRGKEDEFLVCRYSEGGNVLGERPF
jgi:hypothetical protein